MTEPEALELVTQVCSEETVSEPTRVYFSDTPHAEWMLYEDGRTQICLPNPEWAAAHDPEVFGEGRYKLVILHELAHHVAWIRHRTQGHSPYMYAKAFQLYVRHGVDLTFAIENEFSYKPRAARRGWDLFRRWALA